MLKTHVFLGLSLLVAAAAYFTLAMMAGDAAVAVSCVNGTCT